MIRHSHKLLLTAVVFGFTAISTISADAGCHGNSCGRSFGSSYGNRYSQPYTSYSPPVYRQPAYPPAVYQQPLPSQQVYGQTPPQFGQPQLPSQQVQPGFAGTVTSPQQGTVPQAGVPQTNALQNFAAPGGSIPSPAGAASPGNLVPANPVNTTAAAADAQQSALQALGGFAPPQAAAAQSSTIAPPNQQATLSGSFKANLSNGARVELSLQADGQFNWVAVNSAGQASSFKGTYQVDNSSLSLSRSTDGQTLSGSLTINSSNGFSFKLADSKSSSLDFVRS